MVLADLHKLWMKLQSKMEKSLMDKNLFEEKQAKKQSVTA